MPNDGYTIYENAIVVPPAQNAKGSYNGKSGVFDSEGNFLEASITKTLNRDKHARPDLPPLDDIPFIEGTHAFGGIFFGHFGHFITESTGRLWVLGEPELQIDKMLYVPKEHVLAARAFTEKERLLAALGIQANIGVISEPTRVERLVVADSGFGLDDILIDGSDRYVAFMKDAMQRQVEPNGGELLYISRRDLPIDRGTILAEDLLEEFLAAEGYELFQPQKFPIEEQIARYRAARKIISVDASPLHLYAFVANDAQKVSIIKRRSMNAVGPIVRHIRAFSNPQLNVVETLQADYVKPRGRIGRSSWGEIDFVALAQQLHAQDMIAHPEKWHNPSPEQIMTQLSFLNEKGECVYERIPVAAE